jgi:hypothetical protein
MSQQIFNPGGGTAVAEPEPELEGPEGPSPNSRNRLFIIGGLVLALVLAGGAYFLFFSGGSSDSVPSGPVAIPSHVVHPKVTTPVKPKAVPSAAAAAVATATPSSRDPFAPLVAPAAPAASGSAAASGSTAPSAGTSGAPAPSAGSTVPTTGTPKSLSILAVNHSGNTVTSSVDGKSFTAPLGGTFDTYFQVIGIDGNQPCAILRYGDVTLNVCQGVKYTLTG